MKYNYNISSGRYGGEYVIGTLDKDKAEHWCNNEDEFSDYFMMWDLEYKKKEFPKVPEKYHIEDYWHDHDDIQHYTTTEWSDSNWFHIENIDTGEEQYVDFGSIDPKIVKVTQDTSHLKKNVGIVYAYSYEKGGWDLMSDDAVPELTNEWAEGIGKHFYPNATQLDAPFDPEKITEVNVDQWEDLLLLTGFTYDNMNFYVSESNTTGKSQGAFIRYIT